MLLLMIAQQGAVVHELSHVSEVSGKQAGAVPGVATTTCALCPAFAQVVTPAFSHSFHIPHLVHAALSFDVAPLYREIDTAVPTPRSRSPPSKI